VSCRVGSRLWCPDGCPVISFELLCTLQFVDC
jgi:hypothetical protein